MKFNTHVGITFTVLSEASLALNFNRWYQGGFFFFPPILWCSWSGHHSYKWFSQIWLHTRYDSTKKPRILLYSWLHAVTYHHRNQSGNSGKKKIFKIWQICSNLSFGYVRQTPMLEKRLYSTTSSIERDFLKGIFHQHTLHIMFYIKINTNFPDKLRKMIVTYHFWLHMRKLIIKKSHHTI